MTALRHTTCTVHGRHHWDRAGCPTDDVLVDIRDHRAFQVFKYGENEDTPDGTGPAVQWLAPIAKSDARWIESRFRAEYESHDEVAPSWMHLVREEVAEAFKENDPARLREELIQVAALCVSWIEQLDGRS